MPKPKDDNRDVFDKALDVAFPIGVAATGAYLGAKGGKLIGRRVAKKAIKQDRAESRGKYGPDDQGPMSAQEAREFTRGAERGFGAMGAMTIGAPAGLAAHQYRQGKKQRRK